ncbi:hypothetical protein Vadar_019590 [Vaccinium darrowii]|uniref:Uncharacterized protein n=1 Tax=Vaccinium darrowii TaxID=229202 RepID=A0ACB7XB24_9ERIC|nr:hypothetical protein Vadar_019590 [Vaccinium darrowii]
MKGSEIQRNRAETGGGDDGWLGLLEGPLNGLTIGFVAELACELEHPGGAEGQQGDVVGRQPLFSPSCVGPWSGFAWVLALGWLICVYRNNLKLLARVAVVVGRPIGHVSLVVVVVVLRLSFQVIGMGKSACVDSAHLSRGVSDF